jgi:hypothetical protein
MGLELKGGYCRDCDKTQKVFRKTPNHILHLILSIVTGGLWLIVWLILMIRFGGWRCDECGSKRVQNVS